MHDLVQKALEFAAKAHAGQTRKYTGEPYLNHCKAVAATVGSVLNATPEMCAAALLHDTIEDTNVTVTDLEIEFGSEVAKLVWYLTEQTPLAAGNRAYRKRLECARLAGTPSAAQTIKLADLLDNTTSIVERDPGFAKVYLREKYALVLALTKADPLLRSKALAVAIDGLRKVYGFEKAGIIKEQIEQTTQNLGV